jgi:hypothetical protein
MSGDSVEEYLKDLKDRAKLHLEHYPLMEKFLPYHECWCDTINGISSECNCCLSVALEEIEDLRLKITKLQLKSTEGL